MKTLITDKRINKIVSLVEDKKKVLNIGCAQNPTIHYLLAKKSSLCIGIDINKKGIEELKYNGYEAYLMNAEKINLKEKFDYIIAGELIEHLSNPGLFLESCLKHLEEKGELIITTPNIASLFLYLLVVSFDKTQDPTHVYYFDKKNLQILVERYNFKINNVYYIPPEIKFHGQDIFFKIFFFLTTFLANLGFIFSQRLFGSYLLMVFKKNDK